MWRFQVKTASRKTQWVTRTQAHWGWLKMEGTGSWRLSGTTGLTHQTHPTAPVMIGDPPELDIAVSHVGDWAAHQNRMCLFSRLIVDGNTAHRYQNWSPLMASQMNGTCSSSIFGRSLTIIISGSMRSKIICWPAFKEKLWHSSGISQRRHIQPNTVWHFGCKVWIPGATVNSKKALSLNQARGGRSVGGLCGSCSDQDIWGIPRHSGWGYSVHHHRELSVGL